MIAPFVTATWLTDHLDAVRLVDARWYLDGRSGREAYTAGHLPGAVFADLDADLAAPASERGGRHPLPAPAAFAGAMRRLGIADGDTVVAYDDAGGVIAARLVWMLRVLGERAAILDGGIDAWEGALATGAPDGSATDADFTSRPWPEEALADADAVARLASGEGVVIDARAAQRFRGEVEPVDARPGHVPGALNRPVSGNLDGGRLADADRLRERFAVAEGRPTVVYCGSGVTACHDLLAMESVGIPGRLYPGSWSQWAGDPRRPVATGDGADGRLD